MSNWVRHHLCDILGKNVAGFYPSLKNLPGLNLKFKWTNFSGRFQGSLILNLSCGC